MTEFVVAPTADTAGLRAPGVLEDVVAALRHLHASPAIGARFPIFRVVEWHARDAAANGVAVPASFAELHAVAQRIEGLAADELEANLCHNDLLPANVLLGSDRFPSIRAAMSVVGQVGLARPSERPARHIRSK